MFNMEKVGRKIAELRKSHNMTQLELADKIGISFQAVSNWERGNSMPDISKLPELASLFDVTIDALLGEKSELIESAAKGDIKEYLEHNDISSEEIRKVAPVLRPDQVDVIYESKKTHDLQEIEDLLPFLSDDVISDIAHKRVAEGKSIEDIAPFICEDDMCEFVDELYQKSGLGGIEDILSFICEDQLEQIADDLYQKSGLDGIENILPFICEDQLEKIAEQEYESKGLWNFEVIAPFLNEDCLNALAQKAIRKDGIKAISHIAPFLDSEMLSEFVREEYLK